MPIINKTSRIFTGAGMLLFLVSCATIDMEYTPLEIPFELNEKGRIIVTATVNGTAGKFVWDTGSFESSVNIPLDNLPVESIKMRPQNREILTYHTLENQIVFDNITLESKSEITKVPEFLAGVFAYDNMQGYLALTIFEGYWCEVSFSEKKIVLHKKKPKNFSKSISAEILGRRYFCVPAKIDGKRIPFMLDTGSILCYFPELIVHQKKPVDSVPVVSKTRPETYYFVKTKNIKFFDKRFKNRIIRTIASIYDNPLPFGILGTEFLQNYDLLFDLRKVRNYKTTRLYYEPRVPIDTEKTALYNTVNRISSSGIVTVVFIEQGAGIHEIIQTGIAYTIFGLRPGMIITKIDGVSISDIVKDIGVERCARKIGDATESTEFTILENGTEYIPKKAK